MGVGLEGKAAGRRWGARTADTARPSGAARTRDELNMVTPCREVIKQLPRIQKGARDLRDIILANLAMISEIPAPTFEEGPRVRFLQQRLSEAGLQNCSTDEAGNALGAIPGEVESNILVVAHADTIFPASQDHTVTFKAKSVTGPGVGDNSVGLAVLVSLPTLLEHLGIALKSTVLLMGASRGLGRGDLEGLKFFLENRRQPIRAGIGVEGVQLGRLSHSSIGMLRGEIHVTVPDEYDWTRFGVASAIRILNDVINALNEIRLPRSPRTSIVLGSVEGGQSYNALARRALLRFEVRSESAAMVREVSRHIKDIATEISAKSGSRVTMDAFARRRPGGVPFGHPLPSQARKIMRALKVAPRISPSTSELSAFIERQIPAVTIGLTTGDRMDEPEETISIEKIFVGVAQLVGILLAIDGGHCDED